MYDLCRFRNDTVNRWRKKILWTAKSKKELFYDKNVENKFKLYQKVRDHCHFTGKLRGSAHSICNSRYKVPKEIPVVFHNGSTYDCHFITKNLPEEFKG